jgi:hypothetical protein
MNTALPRMDRLVAGRYRIVEPLGGGGTSLVFRAEVVGGGPDVAIKQLRPQFAADPSLRRRFLREAELSRQLDHPFIVRLLDTGEDAGGPLVVLELVRGETLRQRLDRDGKLPIGEARSVFIQLARALDHAHSRGIIHRDVKPQNIFLTAAGARLGDFGNARVVSLASVTGASLTWGTPEYVAPEVFVRGRADPRSDFYSLGVVLYEMLTGRLPWSRSETLARLAGHRDESRGFAPTGAGESVDRSIADLLAYSPADRPASGEDAILRSVAGGADVIAIVQCSACGVKRPQDVPRCLSCGVQVSSLAHHPSEDWRLVLRTLADDAARIEALLRLIESLALPAEGPLMFLTGDRAMYSASELKTGIELPAVLFSRLDEPTARTLADLFREHGFDAAAMKRRSVKYERPETGANNRSLIHVLPFPLIMGASMGTFAGSYWVGLAATAAMSVFVVATFRQQGRIRAVGASGVLRLRERAAAMPEADRLLVEAKTAAASVRAPDVRELLADVAVELYRLTQRAAKLAGGGAPSSEVDLLRRTTAAGPIVLERLRRMAMRLDDLDAALAGQSEGELMQTMARLERAAAAPDADRAALAATRRDLETALDRRHATEQERGRLSAKLCQLLGHLRLVYRQALTMKTPVELEARALEVASAELDALLAAPAPR